MNEWLSAGEAHSRMNDITAHERCGEDGGEKRSRLCLARSEKVPLALPLSFAIWDTFSLYFIREEINDKRWQKGRRNSLSLPSEKEEDVKRRENLWKSLRLFLLVQRRVHSTFKHLKLKFCSMCKWTVRKRWIHNEHWATLRQPTIDNSYRDEISSAKIRQETLTFSQNSSFRTYLE